MDWKDYKLRQRFLLNRHPKGAHTPPVNYRNPRATCELRLTAADPDIDDKFSWRDVRGLAQDIIEHCQPPKESGIGGWSLVGPKQVWIFRVIGVEPVPFTVV